MSAQTRENNISDIAYITINNIKSLDNNSISYYETFDHEALQMILDNQNHYKTLMRESCFSSDTYCPFKLSSDYINKAKIYKDGLCKIKVNYQQSGCLKNRYFADKSLSMQNLPREIRWTIGHKYYWDLDIVNCHPVVLKYLCKGWNIDTPVLNKYVSDRKAFIKKIGLDYEVGKLKLISIIDGNGNSNPKLAKFHEEMKNIREKISKLRPKEYKILKEIGKDNPPGSLISHVMSEVENDIIQFMVKYLKNNKIIKNNCVLCFDGIMVLKKNIKNNKVLNSLLRDLEKAVNTNWKGLGMKLKVKKMKSMPLPKSTDSGFTKEDIMALAGDELDSECILDEKKDDKKDVIKSEKIGNEYLSDDSYFWYDFMHGGVLDSIDDIKNYLKENINRVMFKTYEGGYYVRKISKTGMFYIDPKCPAENFQYTEKKYNKIGKLISEELKGISLSTLLGKEGLSGCVNTYNKMTFDPSFRGERNRQFNTWTGFNAKLLDKDQVDESKCKLVLDAIYDIWAAKDDAIYKYILSWFNHIFTKPYEKSKVVIVLNSPEKQIGKGILINDFLIKLVFGDNYAMGLAGLDTVASKFNEILMNKMFINCDELSSLQGNNFHALFDKLKNKITDPTMQIEIKGGKSFIYPDFSNFIYCTNNDFTIKIEEGDARYFITQCSPCHKGDFKYYNDLSSTFNDETANHFFSYIYYMQDPVEIRNIIETPLKREMMINCLSTPKKFIYSIKEIRNDDEDYEKFDWKYSMKNNSKIKASLFYNYYNKFCDEEGERSLSKTKFGREIKTLIVKKRSNGMIYDLTTINV